MLRRGFDYVADSWGNYIGNFNIIILLGGCAFYFINKYLKTITTNFIVHWYFNDFLALILLLSFSNILLQKKG